MNTEQIIKELQKLMSHYDGGERELYEALLDEASGWEMRLKELDEDEE